MLCTVKDIIAVVGREYRLTPERLLERTRRIAIARPRQIAMWIACHHTKLSLPAIGVEFGGFDHTTIMYARDTISEMMSKDPELARQVHKLAIAANARATQRRASTEMQLAARTPVVQSSQP